VITFHVGAEWGEDRRIIGRIQTDLLTELARRPGVLAAGMTNFLPASRATLRYEISLEGYSAQPETNKILVGERTVGGDYFQTLRLPLIQGRSCPELRPVGSGAPAKAVVNRRFVEMYGTGAPLIGRRLGFGKTADTEIVGIVADAREDSLDAPPFPYVYDCLPAGSWPDPEYVVRGSGDPRAILATVRDVVRSIAPKRALFGVESLREYVEASLDTPRLSSEVLALFAGIALVLASVGLYSLVMLAVTAQTKEIGLRVALGALPSRILGSVMLEAAAPVVLGLASGALLAVIALRAPIVRPLLFDVGPSDGLTLLCVAATLAIVSTAAALIPARRAATIDPVRALRED
jgi:putative ABC transport system permease protein